MLREIDIGNIVTMKRKKMMPEIQKLQFVQDIKTGNVYLMKTCESKTTINFLGGSLDLPYNLINENNLKGLVKIL